MVSHLSSDAGVLLASVPWLPCAVRAASVASEVFLLTNRTKQMVFWDANGLNPFYGKIMGREVDAKMNEWVKMMQGESMEDYAIRVNDETRIKQQQLFAQEVATALAGDRISMDNPFIDGYDASNNMLNIGFKGLPSIGLEVQQYVTEPSRCK